MAIDNTRTVLLVEDEDTILAALQTALTQSGWHVLTASNGLEALSLYNNHQDAISIVVTDVEMPGLSGPLLAQQLRQKRPGLAILFMSGGAGIDPLPPTDACSKHAFLQKPFLLAEFFSLLSRLSP